MSAADLQVDGVSWGQGAGKGRDQSLILNQTSFHVPAGQVLGIVGANGAGKTTLLRLVYRYAKPLTGVVKIGGQDLWAMTPRAAARKVAAVLQEQPTDFALTVRDVVALGRLPHRQGFASGGKESAAIIEAALNRMGLLQFATRSLGTLSGGERQRVMVARALAQDPDVLVLDEPTNHLDIRHQLEVLRLIRDLDMTIVTSLHDLNMAAEVCDQILLLHKGLPLGFGPAAEVLSSDRVSKAFGVEARLDHLRLGDRRHLTFHLNNDQ
jgi:iron complex transport system ATP-binding protein